ncbi:MAG: hypothetical protein OXU36_20260 [Candidatus Poribacteria bacterium]|nr:hypothetical protein [Candidatus Poribacteria bacterium]
MVLVSLPIDPYIVSFSICRLWHRNGGSVVWPDLEDAVACEGLNIFLTGKLAD